MPTRHAKRLLNEELPRGYFLATVCRPHYVLYERLRGGRKEPLHTFGHITDFSHLQNNCTKSAFVGFGIPWKRSYNAQGHGNINGESAFVIFGLVTEEGLDVEH